MKEVGAHGMRSSVLFGDNQIIKETVEYIEKTGRFRLDQRKLMEATTEEAIVPHGEEVFSLFISE
jgi:hypothetical protein